MWEVLMQYNGDSLYLFAFALCLGLTVFQGEKRGDGIWRQAAFCALLVILFVYNGVSYRIAGKITKDIKTYYRFFWMLPVLFLIAYQATLAFTSGQKKKMAIAGMLLALCVLVGGNCFLSKKNIRRPENIYGIAQDAIDVTDAVMADWGEKKGNPVVAFDIYLEYQARAYEPRVVWGISRKAYLYQAQHGYDGKKYRKEQPVIAAVNEGIKQNSRKLARCVKKLGIDYLVIQSAFDMDDYLLGMAAPVAASENYTVYKIE